MQNLVFILFLSFLFTQDYDIGDQITEDHQNVLHSICAGAEEHGYGNNPNLSLSFFNE